MNTTGFTRERLHAFIEHYHVQMEEELFEGELGEHSYASAILDAKYEPATPEQIIEDNCAHLSNDQQKDLFHVFTERSTLVDGKLRKFKGPKMDIHLIDGAKPPWKRAYPVAHIHQEPFRRELMHLCEIGVLSRCGKSAFGAPTFVRHLRRTAGFGL